MKSTPPPSAIASQIAIAENTLLQKRDNQPHDEMAVLFTGNWHESFPRQLIINPILTPTEKTTWQVIRLSIQNPQQPGAAPRRDELAQLINCSPPTVTASRAMLRACRWMTFCKHVRKQGKFVGDIYLLHDEPLSLAATLETDTSFIAFLTKSLAASTANQKLKRICQQTLDEIDQFNGDPEELTELKRMAGRFKRQNSGIHQSKILTPVDSPTPPSFPSENATNGLETVETRHQSKIFTSVEKNIFEETVFHQSKNFTPGEKMISFEEIDDKNYLPSLYLCSSGSNSKNNNCSGSTVRAYEEKNMAEQENNFQAEQTPGLNYFFDEVTKYYIRDRIIIIQQLGYR